MAPLRSGKMMKARILVPFAWAARATVNPFFPPPVVYILMSLSPLRLFVAGATISNRAFFFKLFSYYFFKFCFEITRVHIDIHFQMVSLFESIQRLSMTTIIIILGDPPSEHNASKLCPFTVL